LLAYLSPFKTSKAESTASPALAYKESMEFKEFLNSDFSAKAGAAAIRRITRIAVLISIKIKFKINL